MWRKMMFAGLVIVFLSACGAKKDGEASIDNLAGAVAKTDPVEIVIHNQDAWPEERFMSEIGNKLNERFPHVKLTYVTGDLTKLITSGLIIDLMLVSIGQTDKLVIANGFQHDISDLIKSYNYDLSRLEPTTVDMQRELAKGGMYGLPLRTSTYTLFYNRDIFDKFAVSYPTSGMTWDQLYETAKKLTRVDNGLQYYGFVMSPGHMLSHNQLSLPGVDPKTQAILFTEDKYRNMLTNFIRFFELPGMDSYKDIMTTSTAKYKDLFYKTQNAAMFAFSTVWRDKPMSDVNWDVVTLPHFKEAVGVGPQSYPSYMFVTSISKHKEQAFEISAYLTSNEYQTYQAQIGVPTVLKDPKISTEFGKGAEWLEFYKGKNIAALNPTKFAAAIPKTDFSKAGDDRVVEAMRKVIIDKKDLNSALREAEELAQKDIEALKSK